MRTSAAMIVAAAASLLVANSEACGLRNREPCSAELPCRGAMTVVDGICTPCGSKNQPFCPEPNMLDCRGSTVNIEGICTACGARNQPVCIDRAEPCNNGYAPDLIDGSTCVRCGGTGESWCIAKNDLRCNPLKTPLADGTCYVCGFQKRDNEQLPQCAITGHYLAEEYDGDANPNLLGRQSALLTFSPMGEAGDVTEYIVTKDDIGSLTNEQSDSFQNINSGPTLFTATDIGFEFPFYGRTMDSFCVSPQGFISFTDSCEDPLEADDTQLLRRHYNQPRVSAYFARWNVADCSASGRPNGCVRTFKSETNGVKHFTVFYSQLQDSDMVSSIRPQFSLRIHENGVIQMSYPWGQAGYRGGVIGLSPIVDRFQGKNAEQVSFSVETCFDGYEAQPDGTCARS